MADTRKPSKVLADTLGIDGSEYAIMEHNARRYERTDAGVEDAVLKQIFNRAATQETLGNENIDPDYKKYLYEAFPGEFGNTKVLNATNVLQAMHVKVPKKEDDETPEQKLVRLWDENPNLVRNRVIMDKEFGDYGAENLPGLIESLRGYRKPKPELSMANKIAGTIFYPRSLESMRAGRDVSAKDIVGDVAENALMAAPLGIAAGVLAKGGRAAKILAGLGAASTVPLATEVMDAAMYSPSENLDRSVFQPSDVLIGASTNAAAPFMLSRITGRAGRMLFGGNPLAKEADDVAKFLPRTDKEAQDIIKTQVDRGAFVVPDERTASRVEKMVADDVTAKQVNNPEYWQAIQGAADFDRGIVNEATIKARGQLAAMDRAYEEIAQRARVMAGYMLAGDSYQEAFRKASSLGPLANRMSKDLYADWYNKIIADEVKPSLGGAMLGSWITNKYGNNRNANMFLGTLGGLVQSVEPDLDIMQKLEDWRDERAQENADRYRGSIAGNVLAGGLGQSLTGSLAVDKPEQEDAYWLARLSQDPSIARGEGLGASSSFKNWWNTRGMKILADTGLFGGVKE